MFILGFLLGSTLGSFILVLADRSLTNKTFWGRSYCPACKKRLAWYDLLPILSYLLLKGRCRYCRKEIPLVYLFVEIITGLLTSFLFWQRFSTLPPFGDYFKIALFILDAIFKTFFIVILLVNFITDFRKLLIPDRIIKPAIVMGAALSLVITIIKVVYLYFYLKGNKVGRFLLPPYSEYFQRHAILAAQPFIYSLGVALLIGAFFYGLIIITKGKGMGGGDVKLGAFMGVMLGFPQALVALVLSFLIGAIVSIALIILKRKHFGQVIPFGPFLVTGSLIALFWGEQILNWYLRLGI